MSRRAQLSRVLDGVGATELLLRLRGARTPSPWLTILTYHRLRPATPNPFDDGVVDASHDEFDWQMKTVARHFDVVGVDELCAWADGGTLPPNPLALTFDDGYRDNHDVVLPTLQRHGLRGIFFITTSYLSERRLFWWDRVAYLLKKSRRDWIELHYPALLHIRLEAPPRSGAMAAVLRLIKNHYDIDVERLLLDLAEVCEVEWTPAIERALADELLMSWDHVRALLAAGMDVQSHTRTHRVLQTLPDERLEDELLLSRTELELELGAQVRAVSYPVGRGIAHVPRIREAVKKAGYQIGFSNASGANPRWRKQDRYDIRRLAVDDHMPRSHFRGMLAIPFLGA